MDAGEGRGIRLVTGICGPSLIASMFSADQEARLSMESNT